MKKLVLLLLIILLVVIAYCIYSRVSVNEPDDPKPVEYQLIIDDDIGVTFIDGENTANLYAGSKFPEVINNTEQSIVGWYVKGNNSEVFATDDFTMPKNNVIVCPVFYVPKGYQSLKLGKMLGYRVSNEVPVLNLSNYTVTDSQTIAVEGSEGKATLLGSIVSSYSDVNFVAGQQLRFSNTVSSTEVVTVNVAHSFLYNLQNFGDGIVDITLYQVNSGTIKEDEGHKVILYPGESVTLDFNMSFTNGSDNNNALTLIEANKDMKGIKLGISTAIKLNQGDV